MVSLVGGKPRGEDTGGRHWQGGEEYGEEKAGRWRNGQRERTASNVKSEMTAFTKSVTKLPFAETPDNATINEKRRLAIFGDAA